MDNLQKYTEDELVLLLQQKDQSAFSYLYDNYSGALNGAIFRMTDDATLSEDILQEAFLKIWKYIGSYDKTKGRLFTWMLNLTKNLTIDTLRSKGYKNQAKISGNENTVSTIQDNSTGIDKFDAMGLRKKLAGLKPEQRTVIELSYFSGYTQEEISKALDIPLGTIKSRLRAAIIELRKQLQYA